MERDTNRTSLLARSAARLAPALGLALGLALELTGSAAAQNQFATSPSYAALLRAAPAGLEGTTTNGIVRATVRAHWQFLSDEAVPAVPGDHMLVSDLGPVSFSSVGPPLVTHVIGEEGPTAGGSSMDVYGLRMLTTGGPTTVAVGGAPANVLFTSSTLVRTTTNAGLNAYGNPLGPSDVVVTTTQGSGARTDAFTYQPAIRNLSSGSIGAALQLEYTSDVAGTFYQLWAGGIFQGVAIPIPPFAGAVEVWNPAFELTPLLLANGQDAAVPIFIPNDPTLVGATLWFQGVSIRQIVPSLLGTFTNALPVTFVP